MFKNTAKYKAKPYVVSLVVVLIALPIVLNSFIRTPETVGDSIDPTRVVEDCSATKNFTGVDEGFTGECEDRTHRSDHPIFGVSLIIHMAAGSMMMLSPIINFNSDILRKKRRLHRTSGYSFILGSTISGATALTMTLYSLENYTLMDAFTQTLWGSLLILYPLLAFRAIKRQDIKSHRSWMIRAYAVAAGPSAHRIFFFLTPYILDFGVSVMTVLLGEFVIRKVRL